MIHADILQKFPELFGTQKVNGREVDIEQMIATLTEELRPEIAAASDRSPRVAAIHLPVRERYAWPDWNDKFEDPVTGIAGRNARSFKA